MEKPSREGRRRRADSDEFDTADRNSGSAHVSPIKSSTASSTPSTNYSVGPSSLTSTPELKIGKRSLAGVEASTKASRSGEKAAEKSSNGSKGEREVKGERRVFLDDADHSGMNSLLNRITQEIEPKGKKGGEKGDKGSSTTTLPSVAAASLPISLSSFSQSTPISAVVTNGVGSPLLSRVLSGPSLTLSPLNPVPSMSYSTPSAVFPSSTTTPSVSSSSSSSRSSSRPSSPSASSSPFSSTLRRPSQPLLFNGVASSAISLPPSSLLSHRQSVPIITSPFTPVSTLPPPSFPSSAMSVAPSTNPIHSRTLSSLEQNGVAPTSPNPLFIPSQPLSRLS